MRDVVIVGAGMAGATAAYGLRDLDIEIVEREGWIGGRTLAHRVNDSLWYNLGASYISEDKVTMFQLADELGVDLLPFDDSGLVGHAIPGYLDQEDVKEVREVVRRIQREQSHERAPSDPSVDLVSFADWLGTVRPRVWRYFEEWCSVFSGHPSKVSLYGVLLMHGLNRVTAFSDDVPRDSRGSVIVEGGTNAIPVALVEGSGRPIALKTSVHKVDPVDDGYRLTLSGPEGKREILTRRIVSSLRAPEVLTLMPFLPEWKKQALSAIEYSPLMSMPIVVGPTDYNSDFHPTAKTNPELTYAPTEFPLRSPTDIDRVGAFFFCGRYSDQVWEIWDEPDEVIKAGVYHAFTKAHPELKGRIMTIEVQRWKYGIARYTVGRMGHTPNLVKSVDGIHFCGDYTDLTHTEGAARSGNRVVKEIRDAISMGGAAPRDGVPQ